MFIRRKGRHSINRNLRCSLLLGSGLVAMMPGLAAAQTTIDGAETSRVTIGDDDVLIVTETGSIVPDDIAVNVKDTTGEGVVIDNSGRIVSTNNRAINGFGNGRQIVTIFNRAGALIQGDNDAIRFQNGGDADSVITIDNAGTISSDNQAIEVRSMADGTQLIVTNREGGAISGGVGIQTNANTSAGGNNILPTTIDNFGTITGLSGEAISLGTRGEKVVNLHSGSTTIGGAGVAVAHYGKDAFTLGLYTDANITGSLLGSADGDAVDTLALLGDGSDDIYADIAEFERLSVRSGTWTVANDFTFTGGATLEGGMLVVDQTLTADTSVQSNAILGGSGTVDGVVTVENGGALYPGMDGTVGTITVGGLILQDGSQLYFDLGSPDDASASDRIQVNGDLTLDGDLFASDIGGFGEGVYRLIDFTGAVTDNGLDIISLPDGYNVEDGTIQVTADGQVNLIISLPATDIQFWDGSGAPGDGIISGGSGSWVNDDNSWANATGTRNGSWDSGFAVFTTVGGTVTVDDDITFSGMQFMVDGYVIADGTGALTITEEATSIRVDPDVTAEISADIGGEGGLFKQDTGTLILSGNNTYTGETNVADGELRLQGGSAIVDSGTVTLGGQALLTVTDDETFETLEGTGTASLLSDLSVGGAGADFVFGGMITGDGALVKEGSGVFTLTGQSDHTGDTLVNAGELRIDGSTASTVFVADGALLSGTGMTGGLDISGTLAPGNSIGTLMVDGDVTLNSGSIFEVEVDPQGNSDLLLASGTVNINGGEVQVLADGTDYARATQYQIIGADSVTGEFDGVSDNLAFLDSSLFYMDDAVLLRLVRNDVSFASVATDPNQVAVATALDAAPFTPLFDTLVNFDAASASQAFELLSGEGFAGTLALLNANAYEDRRPFVDRLSGPIVEGAGIWADASIMDSSVDATDGYAAGDSLRAAFSTGFEFGIGDFGKIGVGGFYGNNDFVFFGPDSQANVKTYGLFGYAGANVGTVALRTTGGYTWYEANYERRFLVTGLSDDLAGQEDGDGWQVYAEAALPLSIGNFSIEPFIGYAHVETNLDGLAENGGIASLTVDEASYQTDSLLGGVRVGGPLVQLARDTQLNLDFELTGQKLLDDNTRAVRTASFSTGGGPFTIGGAQPGDTLVDLKLGVTLPAMGGEFSAAGLGTFGDGYDSYGAKISMIWGF
ncbi:autotransporter domain-containing protein [Paraurantiacibacter namhicola]|uniref:Extracellular serine protease n=1 Tax=Paraurantiacibacter namhicola TaxID=645517 RepID=A0A1C7D6V7_9SPHN|nr:autotransporter domain-containing protein [Paraurantiacibacter namhicola]ANU07226.1 Extracellular serine protease precursor [Paraurantiacibacter namhicola]